MAEKKESPKKEVLKVNAKIAQEGYQAKIKNRVIYIGFIEENKDGVPVLTKGNFIVQRGDERKGDKVVYSTENIYEIAELTDYEKYVLGMAKVVEAPADFLNKFYEELNRA